MLSRCIRCGYAVEGIVSRCPKCGYLTRLEYDHLRWSVDKGTPSMWRFSRMLPPVDRKISFGEGYTPLRRLHGVPVKMENHNPTRSYADRASSVIVSFRAPKGARIGYVKDFAPSIAYYLRSLGSRVEVLIDPENVMFDDILFLDKLGTKITLSRNCCQGPEGQAYEDPLSIEGLKTIAYEIAEASPREDEVFVPAETGLLAYSMGKGLEEAVELGIAQEYGLTAVTVKGSAPPGLLKYSRYKIRVMEVSSEEIVKAILVLSRAGVRVRPLAATSYAAALTNGYGIALITGSSKTTLLPANMRLSRLKTMILDVLREGSRATAYEIWRELEGEYSLKGVYKALDSLESQGYICSSHVMRGTRKVRMYSI